MKKPVLRFILLFSLLTLILPAASAELRQSPYLDAAFSMLEKDNIFMRRYNELTGSQAEALFELGMPYMFGGHDANAIMARYPEYAKRKCWENTKFYRIDKVYIYGFDCSGYTRWICTQCGLPEHDLLSNMILRYYENGEHYLYTHKTGLPPCDQLKDTLRVGDFLVTKHAARHIMMYIGTLRDFGFTAEEVPELADYLDYPLVVHCGAHPDYGERFQRFIDEHPDYYGNCLTTDGGVNVSILDVPRDAAPCHARVQNTDYDYFPLDEGRCKLTIMGMADSSSYCWYRMEP